MRVYRRLHVRLPKRHRDKLDNVLRGGIQPVRVVLRALALSQLHQGKAASEVADNVRLTSKAVRSRDKLDNVLRGGIQPVRVVLRALALSQLHQGKAASEVADNVRLTSKAV